MENGEIGKSAGDYGAAAIFFYVELRSPEPLRLACGEHLEVEICQQAMKGDTNSMLLYDT